MQSYLKKNKKPNCSDEFTELSCGLFIYNHQNLCCSQKLYLITWLIFLMLKVLSNYTIIKCNLLNRNKDKTSNQKLFLHSQIFSEGVSCNEFTNVYCRTSRTKLASFFLSSSDSALGIHLHSYTMKVITLITDLLLYNQQWKSKVCEEGRGKKIDFLLNKIVRSSISFCKGSTYVNIELLWSQVWPNLQEDRFYLFLHNKVRKTSERHDLQRRQPETGAGICSVPIQSNKGIKVERLGSGR